MVDSILHFFKGGVFMAPIALILCLGLAIAIERWIFLQATAVKNSALWNRITPHLRTGDVDRMVKEAEASSSILGSVLKYGLARVKSARSREDIEIAMEESMMEAMPKIEKRTHYLSTFANVATLLGLLGTVMGLIHAFGAIAGVAASEKSTMLSSAISEAMNCTAFGLITAVPLMLLHSWLQTKATDLEDSLEMAAVKFLNVVTEVGPFKSAANKPSAGY